MNGILLNYVNFLKMKILKYVIFLFKLDIIDNVVYNKIIELLNNNKSFDDYFEYRYEYRYESIVIEKGKLYPTENNITGIQDRIVIKNDIVIFKGNDDYYYVSLVRTNVIPLGENTKLSTFFNNGMYFKCDQLSGLNQLLRKLLS